MLGSGRLGFPQDVPVTSHATLIDLVTVLPRITPYHVTCNARAGHAPPSTHPIIANRQNGLASTRDNQVTYDKSYDVLLRHHDETLDAPWKAVFKAQGVSHIPWRQLSASRSHPTASTTIVTAVLDGGLAGFNSHRQRTAPHMRWPGQNPTSGHTGKTQVRLAAAALRGAVALELVAGKVWALPKTPKASSRRCRAGTTPRFTR